MARLDLLSEPSLIYVRVMSRVTISRTEPSVSTPVVEGNAQRRLLEIRTGIPNLTPPKLPGISRRVSELEALYALRGLAVAGPARGRFSGMTAVSEAISRRQLTPRGRVL